MTLESSTKKKSLFEYLYIVFCGMCMGVADLVPGISGGTIAFIMGFYSDLLNGIKSFSIRYFYKSNESKFLLTLLCGISLSLIIFAPIFDKILNEETTRSYLYSGFLGLILASIVLCFKQIQKWKKSYVLFLLAGVFFGFVLTSVNLNPTNFSFSSESLFGIDLWLMFCGSIAVCALLLPGISGSYLLTILGCYSTVIGALADFIEASKNMMFDFESFAILESLALGILIGAVLFSRVVLFLLKNYRTFTLSLMTGFMIGALPIVWPFWVYSYVLNPLKLEKGLRLQPDFPILPEITPSLSFPLLLTLAGFALVFTVEALSKQKGGLENKA